MLPPLWFRRAVLAPAVPVLTVVLFVTLPVAVIVASIASVRLPGRWRALRVTFFALVYLAADSATLLWLLFAWVASGFGRHLGRDDWQARHYAVMRRELAVLVAAGRQTFRVDFATQIDDLPSRGTGSSGPILVFSRHAGPGDSLLLVHALLQRGFRPRVVLKGTLRWSPVIDVALSRLPAHFVDTGAPRGASTAAIRALAAGLGDDGALVLFPEGRNYTPHRRLRSIAKLEEQGRHAEAEQAREMRHVLRPRSGGAIAALEGRPSADVFFVVHTGLEDFSSLADLWRGIPMDATLRVRGWHVPRTEIPGSRHAADAWLHWWWRRMDAWLVDHFGTTAVPDAVADAVAGDDPRPPPTTQT